VEPGRHGRAESCSQSIGSQSHGVSRQNLHLPQVLAGWAGHRGTVGQSARRIGGGPNCGGGLMKLSYQRATTWSDTLPVDQTSVDQWDRYRLTSSILDHMPLEEWPAGRWG
jgi:hypothetical protein